MQQGRLDVAEKELSEALKMAMGGMAYEKQRPAAAKAALSTVKNSGGEKRRTGRNQCRETGW